ncbi:MAG: Rpn family recombination-promoting nuclease/putative transposase [Lachnospiraceae bacterium]|nr:Rpn family recombination-promoting nuclease/putative transposase [Lachnospiraceae bacterium]
MLVLFGKEQIIITYSKDNNTNIPEYIRKSIKPLSELNLIDNFLFSTLVENPEYAKKLAKLVVKRATGREINNFTVESQKEVNGTNTDKRGIRIDVLIKVEGDKEEIKEVYDIEPNAYYEKDIAKRNRYYNALTDSKLLNKGEEFGVLPELITIWILQYDPFGKDKMIYTIKNIVDKNPDIVYNDGITTLILNAKGKKFGNEALKNLLDFFVNTDKQVDDAELQEIQNIVKTIKGDAKVGERYMTLGSTLYYEKKMSFEEGREEGREEAILLGEQQQRKMEENLIALGVSPEIISKAKETIN